MNNQARIRKARPLTPERLENAAVFYLGRFSSTSENLRRVLERRIARAQDLEAEEKARLAAFVEAMIERFQGLGYLDDAAYVQGQVAALRRQGASTRGIAQKLRAKGAGREEIGAGLEGSDGSDGEAAWIFARRRRLGPYREAGKRVEFRQKDMAALGRAGFDYGTARAVVDAPDTEAER